MGREDRRKKAVVKEASRVMERIDYIWAMCFNGMEMLENFEVLRRALRDFE